MGKLAQALKQKYPQYNSYDDDQLEQAVVKKYPQYRVHLDSGWDFQKELSDTMAEGEPKAEEPSTFDSIADVAKKGMGIISTPFRGLGMLVDAARAGLSGTPMETRITSDANYLTGTGIDTPGLGEYAMQGVEDIAHSVPWQGMASQPFGDVKVQTTEERRAERNRLLEGAGTLGRLGKLSRAVGTTALGAATDPSVAILGPLSVAAKASSKAAAIYSALQRGMQGGMAIENAHGVKEYIEAGKRYGFDSPQADNIGVDVLANLGMVAGLEAHGRMTERGRKRAGQFEQEFVQPDDARDRAHRVERPAPLEEDFSQGTPDTIQPPPPSVEEQFAAVRGRTKEHGIEIPQQAEAETITPPPTAETPLRSAREGQIVGDVAAKLETEGLQKGTPEYEARARELTLEMTGRKRPGTRTNRLLEQLGVKAQEARQRLDQRALELQETIKKGGKEAGAAPNIAADIADYSIVLADRIAQGAVKFHEFVRELPEHLREHAQDIWDRAQDSLRKMDVYHGEEGASGAGGGFWTTDPKRAASYGSEVKKLQISRRDFEKGQAEARRQGQAGPMDTFLSPEQTKGAVPHKVEADVYEASDQGDGADVLASLGVKRFEPGQTTKGEKWNAETGATTLHLEAANAIIDGAKALKTPAKALNEAGKPVADLYQASLAGGIATALRNATAGFTEGGLMAMADAINVAGNHLAGRHQLAKEHSAKLGQRWKNLSTGALAKALYDTLPNVAPVGGKALRKTMGRNKELATLEQMGAAYAPTELHERFQHLMGEQVRTGHSVRSLNKTEKVGKFLMIFNELVDRAQRLNVMKVELAPLMEEVGAKDYNELWQKATGDDDLSIRLGDAIAKAETAALQRTKGLGPKSESARRITAAFNAVPVLKIAQPFTNFLFNNFVPNMMESMPLTQELTQRGNRARAAAYETNLQNMRRKVKEVRQLAKEKGVAQHDYGLKSQQYKEASSRWQMAAREYQQMKTASMKERETGVYSQSYRNSLQTVGPVLIALGIAARLSRGEDGLDWNQTPGETDEKGNKRVRNISSVLGALGLPFMIGDALARNVLMGSDYYKGRLGKKGLEAATGGGQGRPGPIDVLQQFGKSDEAGTEGLRKFAADFGQGMGKAGWVGDLYRMGEEMLKGQQNYKRPDLSEKPSKDTPFFSAAGRGVASQWGGDVQEGYDSSSGEKREKPTLMDTLLHLGAGEKKLSPLTQFIQSHPDLDPRGVLMKQYGVPEWDEKRYAVFRERLEKEVIPIIKDASLPEKTKEEFVKSRLRNIIQHATKTANMGTETEKLPEKIVETTREKMEKDKLKKENKKLFKPVRIKGGASMRKGEQRKFEKRIGEVVQ